MGVIIGLPIVAIALFAIFPNLNESSFAAPFSRIISIFNDTDLSEATFNSLKLATLVTLISALLGVKLGYLRTKAGNKYGKIWDLLFLVPFLIPPYIGSLAWMQLLQRNGFVEQVLGFNLSDELYSFMGLVIVMSLHLFPLIYFSASKAFAMVGSRYSEVGKVFGASKLNLFLRIELPMIMPAVLSTALIVFILTIEEFGTPEILGRRFGLEVMVTSIHDKFTNWPIDLSGAAVLSLLLIIIAFCALQIQNVLSRRFNTELDSQSIANDNAQTSHFSLIYHLPLLIVAIVAVGLPIISILLSAFMLRVSGGLTSGNFGWSNFEAIFREGSDGLHAVYTSLSLALGASLITVVLGIIVTFVLIRLRPRGAFILDFLSILPNSIPGMAIAVGLILTWNLSFWPISPYNTIWVLLIAYICLMLPYPIRMLSAALKQLPESLDEAAYMNGASEIKVISKILLPLLMPIALAAGFIVFAISTRELVSSLMLAPPGVSTVATFVFSQFDQGSINEGMAMSIFVIVLSGTIITLGQTLQRKVYKQ